MALDARRCRRRHNDSFAVVAYVAPKWSPSRTPGDADCDTMKASRWYTAYAMQRQAVDRAATSGVRGLSGDSPVLVDDRTELASAVGLAPLCLEPS